MGVATRSGKVGREIADDVERPRVEEGCEESGRVEVDCKFSRAEEILRWPRVHCHGSLGVETSKSGSSCIERRNGLHVR